MGPEQESLYELPQCTICRQVMRQDFGNLQCGHVFHISCISQHFQYKGTCPNCQKRAHLKEIRNIIFPVIHNSKGLSCLRELVVNLNASESKQIDAMLQQFQKMAQEAERLQERIKNLEEECSTRGRMVQQLRCELNQEKAGNDTLKKQVNKLRQKALEQHESLKEAQMTEIKLRRDLDVYRATEVQYDKWRQIKKVMLDKSQSIVQYKNQLESKQTPAQQLVRIFFDMLLLKNLQVTKYKDRSTEQPKKILEKDFEINKLKSNLKAIESQLKDVQLAKNLQRKKYDELKIKHVKLIEKYRTVGSNSMDNIQFEDSSSRSHTVNKSSQVKNIAISSLVMPPPKTLQSFESFGNFNMKKKAY